MSTITIELFAPESVPAIWKARIIELGLDSPIGCGATKGKAVNQLFNLTNCCGLFANKGLDQDIMTNVTEIKFVELKLPEKQMTAPKFVVPEYVVQCINELDFSNMNIDTATGMSRALTMTIDENHRGIFTYYPNTVLFFSPAKVEVKVDFSDIPLPNLDESFRAALIKRCQRVGQAILDAQNKPKPIDPNEGLPEITEGLFDGLILDISGNFLGKFGEEYGMYASRKFTGTDDQDSYGVFQEPDVNCEFYIHSYKGQEIDTISFAIDFPCKITTENLATAIPERIRLVREARAKALQDAGLGG